MAKDKANSPPASVPVKSPTRDEGKYFELVGAKEGEVVVRFPPEASGFLHIGHAKAALLNAHYQRLYKGRLVFRFDDTNPEKEKESFEKIIEGDVELLEIKPDHRSYTSDHFADLLKKAEEMIKNGKAYVDDTPPEQMKADREARVESKNRSNDVAKNLAMWKEMVDGTALGLTYCLRAKVDMTSDNGCMRDPTIYRCKPQEHPRTGNTYKVYPTYDFACPYVDSVEGITHALRTSEYMDRDVQYYWFCDAMNIRRPQIAAYSRLNLMNTVLSKRKLTYFVQEGIVDGWDDPRMPTVRGVLRRGLTVEGLKLFIASQGSSKAVVVMEWDKIWAFNRKVIDPLAARYSAVELADVVRVQLEDDVPAGQVLTVALHPKNAELGSREVPTGKQLLIDQTDAQLIVPNSNVTFINWGNVNIVAVEKDAASGLVTAIKGKLNLENKDYKKTLKVTWLEGGNPVNTIPAFLTYYDHIIKKPVVGKDEDFKQYVNRDSKMTVPALVDGALKNATKGTIVQIQRKGFFIVDEPYNGEATVDFTGKPKPIILISVPDGTMDINIFPKVVQEWRKKNAYLGEPTAAKGGDKSTTPVASTAAKVDVSKLDAELSSLSVQIDQLTAQFSKLKLQYKSVAKKDWKPTAAVSAATSSPSAPAAVDSVADLDKQIRQQGDLVRKLKADKAAKATVEEAVKKLLSLKGEFKTVSKVDWKPDFVPPQSSAAAGASNAAGTVDSDGNAVADLDKQIRQQGDLVRKLKADKADKATVEEAVKKLLSLKGEFKTAAKIDWKPDFVPPQSSAAAAGASNAAGTVDSDGKALDSQIKAQGDRVRQLKTAKASAEALKPEVEKLLALKKQFKEVTGTEWKPEQQVPTSSKAKTAAAPAEAATAKSGKQAKSAKTTPAPSAGPAGDSSGKVVKKTTRLGMETSKAANYSEWFTEVITKAEMIEYYDVSGCYILRPWSYAIWEAIQGFFDAKIKTLGVKNCYFPCFISKSALETEKTHIADFAPEVAWVTKSGTSELSEPIAIRPTSETVMYPSYAKWTQSHRDLPIQLNQWCNVVRWEFKQPTPFLRTREFLWQEGHSAFATKDETMKEVLTILDFYAAVYEELLAIPVIKGQKTEKEKFAGGDMTTTIEAYVDVNGRGIQGATSHFLGQNFSKMFDLSFEDPNNAGQKCYAYQTSWGLSTRTIGAMIMIHGDDKGLVLPPRVACLQVIIVPCGITVKSSKEEEESLIEQCNQLAKTLKDGGVKVQVDDRDHVSPGWKFNHWELKGVPIRVELGPKDLAKGEFVTVRRDTGEKESAQLVNALSTVKTLLESIHKTLFDRATKLRDDRMVVTEDWKVLLDRLNEKYIIMAPFCGDKDCEDVIKKDSTRDDTEDAAGGPLMGAKSLCIPFKQPKELQDGQACIHPDCKRKALKYTLFGRSY